VILKYSAIALPKITASKHKIHTLGNVLLITRTIADCTSKSTSEGSTFPVMLGSIAKQHIIIRTDRSTTIKYPKIISFKSAIKIPDNVLIKKRDK